MTHVTACIDGSASAPAVCDYAAWAGQRLEAPLTFLHVLDQRQYPVSADLSGNIGLGSREHLLDELASQDCWTKNAENRPWSRGASCSPLPRREPWPKA